MKKKPLYLETTTVSAMKSASEVQTVLHQAGARQIAMEFGADKQIIGMAFILDVGNAHQLAFSLPVRVDPIFAILRKRASRNRYVAGAEAKLKAQAERIAWRQLLRWTQAQLAMIETGMAASVEVFMPYLTNQQGRTMFEAFAESGFKLLAAPEVKQS